MPRPDLFRLSALVLIAAIAGAYPGFWGMEPMAGAAWADDDDDGGDDDDDDGGRANTGQGRDDRPALRTKGRQTPQPKRRIAPRIVPAPPPVLPVFAPEVVTLGMTEADVAVLIGEGFTLIETQDLPGIGSRMHRFAPPERLTLAAARDQVRALPSGASADFNHYYRSEQALTPAAAPVAAHVGCGHGNCRSHELIAWPDLAARKAQCPALPEIGVIDTGVNAAHDLLAGARIDIHHLAPEGGASSAQVHGTAVVSVLAGRLGSRVEGLLPEAHYVVADIFTKAGADERADVAALLRGLDLMAGRGVRVVNLSLAGPANTVLETGVRGLVEERRMVLVAAVGNAGSGQMVAYPAAYDGVIGVTALDARGRVYRAAQQGSGVDLAAPGVGLLLATSVSGAREKTGTSFATPFVTAAAALVLAQEPMLGPTEVAGRLAATARDAGAAGRDDTFGHGLLQAAALCAAPPFAPEESPQVE